MNIPNIKFQHGVLLEPFFKTCTLIKQPDYIEPSIDDFNIVLEKNVASWNEVKDLFFNFLHEQLGAGFKREVIDAYVVRGARVSLSNPLIIKFTRDSKQFQYELIHELIHIILSENKFKSGFMNEPKTTRNHIYLFALVEKFYNDVLKDQAMLLKIKKLSVNDEYRKAWEIVEIYGCDLIIKKLLNLNKNHTPE